MTQPWSLPVVAETYDGMLNDIGRIPRHRRTCGEALSSARGGRVVEGCVGGRHRDDRLRMEGRNRHRVATARSQIPAVIQLESWSSSIADVPTN